MIALKIVGCILAAVSAAATTGCDGGKTTVANPVFKRPKHGCTTSLQIVGLVRFAKALRHAIVLCSGKPSARRVYTLFALLSPRTFEHERRQKWIKRNSLFRHHLLRCGSSLNT